MGHKNTAEERHQMIASSAMGHNPKTLKSTGSNMTTEKKADVGKRARKPSDTTNTGISTICTSKDKISTLNSIAASTSKFKVMQARKKSVLVDIS